MYIIFYFITKCCISIVGLKILFLVSFLCFDQNVLLGQCPVWTQWKLLVFRIFQLF